MYTEVNVAGKDFIIVHAELLNFSPNRKLKSYKPCELLFKSPDYESVYYENKYLVTGHLPTRYIENAEDNKIYITNNHIAIDCGAGFRGQSRMYQIEII